MNRYNVGDIVDMHCGEQGIVVEILNDDWVLLLQCNGHIEKAFISDIWPADTEQNGKAALHELFIKTLGYSGIEDEEDNELQGPYFPDEDVPF